MNDLRSRCSDLFLALAILVTWSAVATMAHAVTSLGGVPNYGVHLTLQPGNVAFGNVSVGNRSTLTVTATNAGTTPVIIFEAAVSTERHLFTAALNCPVVLQPGSSAKVQVTFAPTRAVEAVSSLVIGAYAENIKLNAYFYAPLTGNGVLTGDLAPNPSSLAFGNLQIGDHETLSETLTNAGSTTVIVSRANVSGAGFRISGLTLPLALSSGSNYTFQVSFSPTATEPATGTLSIISDAKDAAIQISLTGGGISAGNLTINPISLNFGNVNLGGSQTLNATLNATTGSVIVSSVSVNSPEFSISGVSFPLTIPAGKSAPFQVTFTPQTAGLANADATFFSNATHSPTTLPLSGTGVAAPPPSVTLSWNQSKSQVIGYNVYRGGSAGGPYTKQNSVLDAQTSYIDSTVKNGTTYYYVTTGVNSQGEESAYSNQAEAVVPPQ